MKLAFIGLGVMGYPMAGHLKKAGHDVTVYNRNREKAARWVVEYGGASAPTPAEAAANMDAVLACVGRDEDLREVTLGRHGAFITMKRDAVFVDHTTASAGIARELAEDAAQRGLHFVDAPVSGGEAGARNAALSIMVGGAAEDFETAKPVFDAVGKTVVHVGPAGSGQTVKAANQLMVAGHLELLAEAIVFLEAYGVDTKAALEVLGGGLAGSTVLQRKGPNMLARDFTPGFRISLHDKDMGIVTAAAREAGVVIPLGAVAAQLVASLKAQGDGGLDHSALLKLVAQLSGRQERQE
jgi:2-hydroxy-3-oxopropionate reductase